MSEKQKILVADDDEKILYAFMELLKKDNYNGIVARNGEEALRKAFEENPDAIFLDITMPRFNGLDVLEEIKKNSPQVPVIIITGFGTMHSAIKAIKQGAFEYLTKPLDLTKIRTVIKQALASTQSSVVTFKDQEHYDAQIVERYELIGKSTLMLEVYKLIGSISMTPNNTSVLITGESGTGKELIARAIHNNSENCNEPFIAINCAAFPETLLESELFGYEKGAFTGALDRKLGKFEIAGQGTIFLDEISNLSLNLQQKLLRVIQNREFERLGGNEIIPVQARFIAATNIEIVPEVKKGNFREDLYYRLNVAAVNLSPLRERKDDIPLLANYFLSKYNYQLKKSVKGFSDEAMQMLLSYSYPGNVRELQNLIERAVMLSKSDIILPDVLRELTSTDGTKPHALPIISQNFSKSKEYVLGLFEKEFIISQLIQSSGNVSKAAQNSSMTRQNFLRMMRKHDIRAEQFRR
ncbi:MAG: sigma-54-dependent Fis family transcriptional regulator [Ignavibacteria bacterium]|jgi:DNA-binding NtrC family response regulator|nr:sigma-54-dependent Fis family transcriptional regulator [Ignavibacteria bacterium]MCU7501641.1 sigma-54-dependent Fis family transcriptional regulator [Ignavibacteria bacterium]MCU7517770.1 sigma-54-dependent Fis family transcriptional regulator [Ignavibacteria bacterium]